MLNIQVKKFVTRTSAVMLATGALVVGANASAAGEEYVVSYTYNELTNSRGVEDVHARIVKAAKAYCPTYSQIRNAKDVRVCVDGVVEDLVSKVNHPQLTSYHESGSSVSVAGEVKRPADRG